MSADELDLEIIRRLDIIIALLLEATGGDDTGTIKGKVMKLHGLGLATAEISSIVGKESKYVSALISTDKKRRRK